MAALFESLAVGGHRLSNGAINASGRAWVYQPGTSNLATIFADADESPLSNPVTLSAGGKAKIYFTGQVDVFFEDANGVPIETIPLAERAERVEVKNAGFTGLLPSGSQGAGGATDLNAILTKLYASFGGLDGKYLEYTGATARKVHDVIQGIQVSVKDYGAVGNGAADDTIAIQSAINEVARLGGGRVYFDPGTYVISSALSVTTSNITLCGAGSNASVITQTNAAADGVSFANCSQVGLVGITVKHATSSTSNSAVLLTSCTGATLFDVVASPAGFLNGAKITGSSGVDVGRCSLAGLGGTSARGLLITGSSSIVSVRTSFLSTSAGTAALEINNSTSVTIQTTSIIGTSTGVIIAAPSTIVVTIFCCPGIATHTTPFSISGSNLVLNQFANGVDGYSIDVTTGGTVTPDLSKGRKIRIRGTTTGAAYTINAPTPAPLTSDRSVLLILEFFNNAGGAITGWTLNAAYKTSSGPSTVDTQHTAYIFSWDADLSVWRELSRDVTT